MILDCNAFAIFDLFITRRCSLVEDYMEDESKILNIDVDSPNDSGPEINPNTPFKYMQQLKELYDKYYVQAHRPKVPKTKTELHLRLKNNKPFQFTCRHLSFFEKNELKKILNDLLDQGIIQSSDSEYSSPIVLIEKRNGKMHMCIDYHTLNQSLESNNYPLPLINNQIEILQGVKYFSSLDLKDGFYHLDVA